MVALILLIVILSVLIFVHEMGHFITAKNRGAYVYEFSLGMGPKIFSFKRKKETKDPTEYSLRAFPIGGFCAIAGEVDEDDGMDVKLKKNQYMCNKKIWERCLILIAGVTMNFITGIVLLFVSALIWGHADQTSIVGFTTKGGPVDMAGIEVGDKITKIDDRKITDWDSITLSLVLKHPSEKYRFKVESSDGSVHTYSVLPDYAFLSEDSELGVNGFYIPSKKEYESATLELDMEDLSNSVLTIKTKDDELTFDNITSEVSEEDGTTAFYLEDGSRFLSLDTSKTEDWKSISISADCDQEKKSTIDVVKDGDEEIHSELALQSEKLFGIGQARKKIYGFGSSIVYAFTKAWSIVKTMCIIIGSLFTGKLSITALSGPVGVYSVVGQAAKTSAESVIYLTAYLSLNLGFINIIPFPAFDGGRVLFLIIEGIRGKKMNPKIENGLNAVGFAILMLLMVLITIKDIINLF